MSKQANPILAGESFNCPHCGAFAHQYWHRAYMGDETKVEHIRVYNPALLNRQLFDEISDPDDRKLAALWIERLERNLLTCQTRRYGISVTRELSNAHLSRCYSCKGIAVWIYGSLVYPEFESKFEPSDDMPPDVKAEFEEAASIYDRSPKGAAALLRLAIQRLMPHLGEKGKDINADIGKLVAKGLSPIIQQSLDVVRVIGNNAVHPGTIDLNDTPETASKLFELVNIIVQSMISTPKQIAAMFADLPPGAKAAIEKRDGTAGDQE